MNYLNLDEDKLLPVVLELNTLLADYNIYYQKLRGFHWNVLGKSFFDLHIQFEDMYNDSKIKIDDIAERILALLHHPVSKFSEYLNISSIEESDVTINDTEMVDILLADHRKLLTQMRVVIEHADNANDEGTIDLIGAYIRELEKASWMLHAWKQRTVDQLGTALLQRSES